jgi:hypothetical protein
MLSHQKLKVYGLNLCVSKAELDAEQRPAGMDLSGRVVWMPRALSGSRPESIPQVRGKDCGKVHVPA